MIAPSAELLRSHDWTFPVPVAYGPGRLKELAALSRSAGSEQPLVVTDRGSAELPFIGQALDTLTNSGLRPALFCDVSPNPTDSDVSNGREAFRAGHHDGVIAIGGGSGMDAGKAISLVATTDHPLRRFDYDHPTSPEIGAAGFVPLLTVPTTAGTGAETESTAMVTVVEEGVKICVWHPQQRPRFALLDPELTVGLPRSLTAWTGVDALVHAIEAFCVPDWHPMCDGLALEAMGLIASSLRAAVKDGSDLAARSEMLVASCLAGVSFLKGLGLVHGMSHMIGAVYDTHHGLTNAVLLPSVLKVNQGGIDHKVEAMATALGAGRTFDELLGWLGQLLDDLDIPSGLSALGVGDDRLDELASKALGDAATATNPVAVDHVVIANLLRSAMVSAR